MIELRFYAKLAIPTRANVFINSSICYELSGLSAVEKLPKAEFPLGRAFTTRLQEHRVESVRKIDSRAYEKI